MVALLKKFTATDRGATYFMTQKTYNTTPLLPRTDDLDLSHIATVLRRALLPLLTIPLLLAATTYAVLDRQPRVYEAATRLMSSIPDSSNNVVAGAAITASQLPQGAVDNVVHSRQTVKRIEQLLRMSKLPATIQSSIRKDLERELADDRYSRLQVRAKLDQLQRGTYEIRASAESPQAAKFLATAATQALLEWDLGRAQQGVKRASNTIKQQLDNVNARLKETSDPVEQQSLISARGQLLLNLSQASAFVEGARGNLTLLADANEPSQPVAPKPKRNAALAFLLSMFAGTGLTLLLDSLRRRVTSTSDLISLGVPVLGELPRLQRIGRAGVVAAARNGNLYEPAGFVRVNLDSALLYTPKIIAVTSARPGEGKSTVVASTATSFALANKRVLIIDSDVHRPMQQEFWKITGKPWVPLGETTTAQQNTLAQAIEHPESASAVDLGGGIHLLPAGSAGRTSAAFLNRPHFPELLRKWAMHYDVVLIDTAPIFALADAFVVARHTDGLVLVVESGESSLRDVERAMQNIQTTRVNLLGMVINKVRKSEQAYYSSYNYSKS